MKKNLKSPEGPGMENQVLKPKLSLENGTWFETHSHIPQEVENDFLHHVAEYEGQFARCKQTTVYERIDKPAWKNIKDIPVDKLRYELDAMLEKLEHNGIVIECITPVKERALYRFITEELFQHEIDDTRIPGMVCNFLYAESHPGHKRKAAPEKGI